MQETKDFDPSRYGLVPIKLETWGGFLFVNLDPDSASLAEYLGDLPARLASYSMSDMVCVRRQEYELACNWKLWVENAKESLHLATVHRKTINQYASADAAGHEILEARGQYVMTAAKHSGSMALLKGDKGFPRIETLVGRAAEGTLAPLIYPCTYLGCTIDCVWYLELLPAGPARTKLIHGACNPAHGSSAQTFPKWFKTITSAGTSRRTRTSWPASCSSAGWPRRSARAAASRTVRRSCSRSTTGFSTVSSARSGRRVSHDADLDATRPPERAEQEARCQRRTSPPSAHREPQIDGLRLLGHG